MSERREIPFRALFRKEWRQLRLVRLVGVAACAAIPAILLAAAELARLAYEVQSVVVNGAPMVLGITWPLLTLFVTAQSFLGDRASEPFLLSLPVRRSWVFWSRFAACAGSSATIVLTSAAAWVLWVLATGGAAALSYSGVPRELVLGGLGVIAALTSGIAAAALVPAPLAAVLAGLGIGVAPLAMVALFKALFPYAFQQGLNSVFYLVPLLLFPGFVLVSHRALCVGEPAGRGRYRRATVSFTGAVAFVALFFLGLAGYASTSNSHWFGWPRGSSSLPLTVITGGQSRGWLVDTSSRLVLERFPAEVTTASWSPDGKILAVASSGGALGRRLRSPKIVIYDAERRALAHQLFAEELGLETVEAMSWTPTHLIVTGTFLPEEYRVGTVRLADGLAQPLSLPLSMLLSRPWAVVTIGGAPFLAIGSARREWNERFVVGLHALDLEGATFDPLPVFDLQPLGAFNPDTARLVRDAGPPALQRLLEPLFSPSGRFWRARNSRSESGLPLFDSRSREMVEVATVRQSDVHWLAGDTLVWVENSIDPPVLRAWDPLRGARDLSPVQPGYSSRLVPSPDLRRLLVFDPPRSTVLEVDLLDAASETRVDLKGVCQGGRLEDWNPWAAPDVLSCRDPGWRLFFHQLSPTRSSTR